MADIMRANEMQDMQDEEGGRFGDPRRCARHPHITVSSPDGMFDSLCHACESEYDAEDAEDGVGWSPDMGGVNR